MSFQVWKSPGKGSQETDSLLEEGLPPGIEDNNKKVDDNDSDSEDEDEDQTVKDARSQRLRETGGWFGYLRDFAIFLPYVIPRGNLKVQLCLVICIITIIIERILQVAIPYTLGIIADKVASGSAPIRELFIFLALDVVHAESGILLLQRLAKIPVQQFSYKELSNAAFNHVMSQSLDFHSTQDTADVMKAVEQGEAFGLVLESIVIDISPTFIDVIVACGVFYRKFDPFVAGLLLSASIVYIAMEACSTRLTTGDRRKVKKAERQQNRKMHQAVQGWQTVTYFNQFRSEARSFSNAVTDHIKAKARFDIKATVINAFVELSVPFTFFGLAYLILQRIASGKASPGDFVFFLTYWDSIIFPLQFLMTHVRWLVSDFVDAERLLQLLQTKPSVVDVADARPLKTLDGNIRFDQVSFLYEPGRYALHDVSFTASPGQTIALVGETGAGKSSILKLLIRLYDVSSGRISISNQNIRDVTLDSLRDAVSVVPQAPMFFNASIMENVRYARSTATDAEVNEACRAAAIHDTIMRYPDGYGTQVGERGVKLSGGEAQRLAIARALLKDAPIVLLDEATSSVDTITEAKIKSALQKLRQGRVVIVIAHRLSTVVDADQILVLHEGKVAERGRHEDLCERKGRYWELWEKS
ncbi:heavy metal tolerance protein [Pyrenochaeta sp. DS3sAY3a]|nr:heavy metal tolerance protein [Pyrenochaeta sp. DS3sAY3a]